MAQQKPLLTELAIDLYKTDKVSLGRAAEIAGIDRWQFQKILYKRHIPVIIDAESAETIDEYITRFFSQAYQKGYGEADLTELAREMKDWEEEQVWPEP